MKWTAGALLALVGALPAGVSGNAAAPAVDVSDIRFPVSAARLNDLRARADVDAQRTHAWDLLATLGIARQVPSFLMWFGAGEVFAADDLRTPESRDPDGAWSLPPKPGLSGGASTGAPLITRAHYNLPAYRHIRDNQLQSAPHLAVLSSTSDEVPAFPPDSVVLKSVWWPVPEYGVVALPVWDPAANQPRRGGNPYVSWARAVGVTQEPGHGGTADLEWMGRSFKRVGVVSIRAFAHQILDERLATSLNADPEVRRLAVMVLGRPLQAQDALVLVALHVATREVTDWIWGTFWWHDRPDEGAFATMRPASLLGAWRNYLMSVSFDQTMPLEKDGSPRIAFNPWLEGRFPDQGNGNGMVSNCMSCHNRASTGLDGPFEVTRGGDKRSGLPRAKPTLRTSSLWSVALQSQ